MVHLCIYFYNEIFIALLCGKLRIVVPDPQPPSRPLPPTPRDDPRQPHKLSTPPSNHQASAGGGGGGSSGGSGAQPVPQRNSHVFKPMVNFCQ